MIGYGLAVTVIILGTVSSPSKLEVIISSTDFDSQEVSGFHWGSC
jgi:hypothetical protein